MPQNEHETDPIQKLPDTSEDEIELIDLLRVVWKRKYLIVGGTAVFALAAAIISFSMPKVYSIDTILEPGILSIINEDGANDRRIYIDTPQNIKSVIDLGAFGEQIFNHLGNPSNDDDFPVHIHFKTRIPAHANALIVSYETARIDNLL